MYLKVKLFQFYGIAQNLFNLICTIWSTSEASEASVMGKQQVNII